MAATDPTISRIRELLEYDPATGYFFWKEARCNIKAGQRAGSVSKRGYRTISVDKKFCAEHRVAWAHVYGEWPIKEIDHINGVKDDNRIVNLRQVSHTENMQNIVTSKKRAKYPGLQGTHYAERLGKWIATLYLGGKNKHLGVFPTTEEAHAAYVAARRIHYPGNTL